MWEPDQGGKIKNNLGINSEIYDTKPRKSEKNIFPEYELENQILTETTWAKSDWGLESLRQDKPYLERHYSVE